MNQSTQHKNQCREVLLQKRKDLSVVFQREASYKIVNHIFDSACFRSAKSIALYHAVRGEADPAALLTTAMTKQFYLPVLSLDADNSLFFSPINRDTQYKKNKFSIPEPLCSESSLVRASDLDLIVMPLLGFDRQGNRLGMGGGYYDRSLSFKKTHVSKPLLMGFAYQWQELESISVDPWDISLDSLVTENGFIKYK